MKIGKTGYRHEVVLNKQLVLLLREFNWTGWKDKTERLVRRMKEWLGIKGYSFKSAMMEAVVEFGSNLKLAQQLVDHRSIHSTAIYTSGTKIRDIIRIVNELVVPGLYPRFGDHNEATVTEALNSLQVPHLRYQEFASDWMTLLKERVYGSTIVAPMTRTRQSTSCPTAQLPRARKGLSTARL
jgi:hypothetical protein